jgi:hypothetical protein
MSATSSQQAPSGSSGHLFVARTLISQLAQNLHLLKLKTLHVAEAPLTKAEEDIFLTEDKSKALTRPGIADEIKHVEESLKQDLPVAMSMLCEQIDSLFRFTFEELQLRVKAQHEVRRLNSISERKLVAAVETQRSLLDKHRSINKQQSVKLSDLEKQLEEVRTTLQRHDEVHKTQMTLYLKEVCVLKEQLYRSYRDKDYVGKNTDLMACLVGDDTGEDVSVDELLMSRRLYRGVERRIGDLQDRIAAQEHDINQKANFISRMEEKMRAQEGTMRTVRADIEQLNAAVLQVEGERDKAKAKNQELINELQSVKGQVELLKRQAIELTSPNLRTPVITPRSRTPRGSTTLDVLQSSDIAFDRFAPKDASTQITPRDSPIETALTGKVFSSLTPTPVHGSAQQPSQGLLSSPTAVLGSRSPAVVKPLTPSMKPIGTPSTINDLKGAEPASLPAPGSEPPGVSVSGQGSIPAVEDLQPWKERVSQLEIELELANNDCDRLRKENGDLAMETRQMLADREEFRSKCEIAEMEAENATTAAAEQARLMTKELTVAAEAIRMLTKRNNALAVAFVSVEERLKALKKRAGIHNYKQRANEFHMRRAEQAIKEAKDASEVVKADARAAVEAANAKVEHMQNQLAVAQEDLRAQDSLHQQTLGYLTKKTAKVQRAFEALLLDFEQLRAEYVRHFNETSENQAAVALRRLTRATGRSRDPKDLPDGVPQEPGSPQSPARQPFLFERDGNKPAPSKFEVQGISISTQVLNEVTRTLSFGDYEAMRKSLQVHSDATAEEKVILAAKATAIILSALYLEMHQQFARLMTLESDLRSRKETAPPTPDGTRPSSRERLSTPNGGRVSSAQLKSAMKKKLEEATDREASKIGVEESALQLAWERVRSALALEERTRTTLTHLREALINADLASFDSSIFALPPPIPQESLPVTRQPSAGGRRAGDGKPPLSFGKDTLGKKTPEPAGSRASSIPPTPKGGILAGAEVSRVSAPPRATASLTELSEPALPRAQDSWATVSSSAKQPLDAGPTPTAITSSLRPNDPRCFPADDSHFGDASAIGLQLRDMEDRFAKGLDPSTKSGLAPWEQFKLRKKKG